MDSSKKNTTISVKVPTKKRFDAFKIQEIKRTNAPVDCDLALTNLLKGKVKK